MATLIGSFSTSVAYADAAADAYEQAMALKQEGKIPAAIEQLRSAIKLREHYVSAHYSLGILLRQIGATDEAITHLALAAELNPKSAKIHYSLALAYHIAGRTDQAIHAMRTAQELDPKDPLAASQLGIFLAKINPKESIKWLDQAHRLEPKNTEYLRLLGVGYRRAALALSDDEANTAERSKFLAESEATLKKAQALESNAHVNFELGVLYRHKKQFKVASGYYRASVDLEPEFSEAWWDLGYCLSASGDRDAAITAYQTFARLQRNPAKVRLAEERIKALQTKP